MGGVFILFCGQFNLSAHGHIIPCVQKHFALRPDGARL